MFFPKFWNKKVWPYPFSQNQLSNKIRTQNSSYNQSTMIGNNESSFSDHNKIDEVFDNINSYRKSNITSVVNIFFFPETYLPLINNFLINKKNFQYKYKSEEMITNPMLFTTHWMYKKAKFKKVIPHFLEKKRKEKPWLQLNRYCFNFGPDEQRPQGIRQNESETTGRI